MKKIVFLTFHNWETKRQGGFHKFAESACQRGYETIFFSFARPYYSYFKKDERLNKRVLKELSKGKKYRVGSTELLNITFPTLALPGPLRRFVPKKLDLWLQTKSFKSFRKFAHKHFSDTDFFVFESNESILLFDVIKKQFPNSKLIYRPSDPLLANPQHILSRHEMLVLKNADWNFLVNQEGFELYKKQIRGFDKQLNYSLLSNGVDIKAYCQKYPVPEALKNKKTALYVGARDPEWILIIEASKILKDWTFIVICPEIPPTAFNEHVAKTNNVIFIPGIESNQVPAWITNCNIVIIPNPIGRYKTKPWGITAKYYQAMAAQKPIIAFHDNPELRKLGIKCTYDYTSFVEECKSAVDLGPIVYKIDLEKKDWSLILLKFFEKIESIL